MRCFRDLAIVVLWTAALLVVLEVGVRAGGMKFDGSFYQPDPICYTAFRPNAAGWLVEGENFCRINSLGMRDRERTVARPARTVRIALLGDSMTAAQQVPLADTMAQVMEREVSRALARQGRRAEVLNFAVGGYSMAQMYLTLREKVWKFQPDIVMAFLSPMSVPSASRRFNHVSGDSPFFVYREGMLVPDPRNGRPPAVNAESLRRSGELKDLYNRVFLAQLGLAAIQTGIPRLFPVQHHAAAAPVGEDNLSAFPYLSKLSPAAAETWHVAEGLLEAMQASAQEHHAEFWIVTHADSVQCDPDAAERETFRKQIGAASLSYTDDRLAGFAESRGIPFLATAAPLLEFATGHHVLLHGFFNTPRNHGHLNVVGNHATGEIVAGGLISRSTRLEASR